MARKPDDDPIATRNDDLAKRDEVEDFLLDLYKDIEKGFEDQNERANNVSELWEIYNCKLGQNQYYSGNTKVFLPIVRDALKARKVRFSNQIFPRSGRYIEVVTEDGTLPYAPMALCEHYVRSSKLRSLIPALITNGDIEGQYTVYVRWDHTSRFVIQRKNVPIVAEPGQKPGEDIEDPDISAETVDEIEIRDEGPVVEVIADSDLCVLPATAASLEDALDQGGSITILRRWTKAKIKQLAEEGEIDETMADELIADMSKDQKGHKRDQSKENVEAAGIHKDGRGKWLLVYEVWTNVKIDDDGPRLCRAFFGGPDKILSCKRNPLWCDRLPIVSCPVDKVAGAFKGVSVIEPGVKDVQYYANDMMNEAADSSMYGMMPIIMTDPEKNPRIGSMILSLAAIWQTSPKDTTFAQFPPLWKDAFEIITNARNQIFQSLSVSPAQITQQATRSTKRNQAEIANEQQVDILTTADAVTLLEDGILTPVVTLFMEMDHQYRDKAKSVPQYGELGRESKMQEVKPLQMNKRYSFVWYGVEQARSTQMVQQQIGALNMFKGIPPQQYPGYKFNIAPAMVNLAQSIFGPRLAPRIFEDIRYQLSTDPEEENTMMLGGVQAMVHPMDDHQAHMQVHMQAMPMDGIGLVRVHMAEHQQAQAAAVAAQAQAMMPKGQPGAPGGAGQGVAGSPRPGAVPAQQRPAQQPPGAIHQDQMPLNFPRRM